MIEMRIVEIGDGCRPEIQYRYHLLATDGSGSLHPPNSNNMWGEWKTAEWVEALEFNGICRDNCQGTKISSLPGLPE